MTRALLHKSKLDHFKAWLEGQDIEHRPGRGDYQALQVLVPRSGWQVVYNHGQAPEHFTVPHPMENLVRKFVHSSKTQVQRLPADDTEGGAL